MALASVSELASFVQQDVDTATAALVLDGASAAVLRAVEDASITVWDSATVPADVKLIVLQVAGRAYDNPTQNTSDTVGMAARQVRVTGVQLTPDELVAVRIAAGLVPAQVPRAMSVPYGC
jgi:3-oxoacyl-[acyl-carrier-protein] synthase III